MDRGVQNRAEFGGRSPRFTQWLDRQLRDRQLVERPGLDRPWPRVLAQPMHHPFNRRLVGVVAMFSPGGPGPLTPEWISDNALDIELAHVHVGRGFPPFADDADTAHAVLQALRRQAVPTVMTVHDLAPPAAPLASTQFLRRVRHLITRFVSLTTDCADDLGTAIGVRPTVIPHGPVLLPAEIVHARRLRARRDPSRSSVLVPLAAMEGPAQLDPVIDAGQALPDGRRVRLLVDPRRSPWTDNAPGRHTRVDVVVTDPDDPDQLSREMAMSHAVLLPFASGCHSRLVELAADVGAPVVTTDVGHYAQQQPVRTVPGSPSIDVDALRHALSAPFRRDLAATPCDRERAAHAFVAGHSHLYDRVRLAPAPPIG